jgi:hypothetical protein
MVNIPAPRKPDAVDLVFFRATDKSLHPDASPFVWNVVFHLLGVNPQPRPPVPGYEQEAGDQHPLPMNDKPLSR